MYRCILRHLRGNRSRSVAARYGLANLHKLNHFKSLWQITEDLRGALELKMPVVAVKVV